MPCFQQVRLFDTRFATRSSACFRRKHTLRQAMLQNAVNGHRFNPVEFSPSSTAIPHISELQKWSQATCASFCIEVMPLTDETQVEDLKKAQCLSLIHQLLGHHAGESPHCMPY